MEHSAVTLEALLADYEATAARWAKFFEANPGASLVPTDIAKSQNIGELVWHIYAASFRHAQRLLGEQVTDLEGTVTVRDIASAFALKDAAVAKLLQFLANTSEASLDEQLEFKSRITGRVSYGSRRKLCLHVLVHAIRHWAQIGTLVRIGGYPPDWGQDIWYSEAIA
ncbi:DinB family protein [Alloacidobacterium dinghuense]|uniref:DinB family protein n=1 Tax=Alloacidobacterium dinghuense TaxID=2763107 RepID=A0A7G8BER0_9BACT|nr:DinB family protein [Alloacidobacterium dinghuense]QNI31030.1 DinB family protein [Alloacidobacterium dinghuense]